MNIRQGDIYWLQPAPEEGIAHPYVVIQVPDNDVDTVTVCALTSNIKRVSLPGNVLLEAGESNLSRPSVVEVSKTASVAPDRLGDYIGTLTPQRVEQILAGIRFVQTAYFRD
ncbi:MAG: PemK family transcriptional regulator [Anaerolineaceae bacterium]|nr:PemK family transcriptional regulator [Anaerolineaceae bacterium]